MYPSSFVVERQKKNFRSVSTAPHSTLIINLISPIKSCKVLPVRNRRRSSSSTGLPPIHVRCPKALIRADHDCRAENIVAACHGNQPANQPPQLSHVKMSKIITTSKSHSHDSYVNRTFFSHQQFTELNPLCPLPPPSFSHYLHPFLWRSSQGDHVGSTRDDASNRACMMRACVSLAWWRQCGRKKAEPLSWVTTTRRLNNYCALLLVRLGALSYPRRRSDEELWRS